MNIESSCILQVLVYHKSFVINFRLVALRKGTTYRDSNKKEETKRVFYVLGGPLKEMVISWDVTSYNKTCIYLNPLFKQFDRSTHFCNHSLTKDKSFYLKVVWLCYTTIAQSDVKKLQLQNLYHKQNIKFSAMF